MNTKLIILSCFVFFLISCAQVVPLTGGDQDIEPPKEVESFPQNGSTFFSEKEIVVEFDEFIQLQNLQSQLVVSPYMENEPQVKVRGKKLIIELNDLLAENTTYSLNFGSAIQDITENNPIPNYKYVFSTGSYVDSLSYSGTVVNAFDLTPVEQVSVLLYTQFEDSVPYLERPRYIAITDKEGKFEITNIAHGKYKVFAIKDINANYLFDLPNEEIAFFNESLELNESKADEQLHLFEEASLEQFVVSSQHKQFGEVKVILNKPAKYLRAIHFDPIGQEFLVEKNSTNDTVSVWWRMPLNIDEEKNYEELLKALESFAIYDSTYLIDTITTSLFTTLDEEPFKMFSNIRGKFDLNKSIELEAPKPLLFMASWGKVKLLEDSIEVNYEKALFDKGPRHITINYPFKEETNYSLVIPKNSFNDIYVVGNDSIRFNFKTKAMTDYGNIALSVSPNFDGNYVIQLLKQGKVVRQVKLKGDAKQNFEYLNPGNYELKLIVDSNKDGKWTTGNYLQGKQAEQVLYYDKKITIKANWDNDISWIIKE